MNKQERMKNIESVYNRCLKEGAKFINQNDLDNNEKKHKKEKVKSNTTNQPGKSKTKLNPYQLFVQTEIKKEKYKNIKASDRLKTIASIWKKDKKNKNKLK